MTDGWIFLTIVSFISLCVFFNGVRFSRMTRNPFEGRKIFGQPIQGTELSVKDINMIGRIQMVFAPLFLLIMMAMIFGLFGPVEGVETIKFN